MQMYGGVSSLAWCILQFYVVWFVAIDFMYQLNQKSEIKQPNL